MIYLVDPAFACLRRLEANLRHFPGHVLRHPRWGKLRQLFHPPIYVLIPLASILNGNVTSRNISGTPISSLGFCEVNWLRIF